METSPLPDFGLAISLYVLRSQTMFLGPLFVPGPQFGLTSVLQAHFSPFLCPTQP
jgi:hypothetical protein